MIKYHYTECGLDNVYIYCPDPIQDDANGKVFQIKSIGLLHTIISIGIILHQYAMSYKELKFLRSEFGFTASEWARILRTDVARVLSWERGDEKIPEATEVLIRKLVTDRLYDRASEYLEYDLDIRHLVEKVGFDVSDMSKRVDRSVLRQNIEIRCDGQHSYTLEAA